MSVGRRQRRSLETGTTPELAPGLYACLDGVEYRLGHRGSTWVLWTGRQTPGFTPTGFTKHGTRRFFRTIAPDEQLECFQGREARHLPGPHDRDHEQHPDQVVAVSRDPRSRDAGFASIDRGQWARPLRTDDPHLRLTTTTGGRASAVGAPQAAEPEGSAYLPQTATGCRGARAQGPARLAAACETLNRMTVVDLNAIHVPEGLAPSSRSGSPHAPVPWRAPPASWASSCCGRPRATPATSSSPSGPTRSRSPPGATARARPRTPIQARRAPPTKPARPHRRRPARVRGRAGRTTARASGLRSRPGPSAGATPAPAGPRLPDRQPRPLRTLCPGTGPRSPRRTPDRPSGRRPARRRRCTPPPELPDGEPAPPELAPFEGRERRDHGRTEGAVDEPPTDEARVGEVRLVEGAPFEVAFSPSVAPRSDAPVKSQSTNAPASLTFGIRAATKVHRSSRRPRMLPTERAAPSSVHPESSDW